MDSTQTRHTLIRRHARASVGAALTLAAFFGLAGAAHAAGFLQTNDLSAPGAAATSVDVAMSPTKGARYIWLCPDAAANNIVQHRRQLPSGFLGGVRDISQAGAAASEPQVAVEPNGGGIFVWIRNGVVQTRRLSITTGQLSPIQDLSAAGEMPQEPRVAVEPGGDAVFTWNGLDAAAVRRVRTRVRAPGGALSATQDLSDAGQSATQPNLDVDPKGNAVYVWNRSNGANQIIQARRRTTAGVLSTVKDLSAPGKNSFRPTVAVSPSGRAFFTWTRFDGDEYVQTRTRSAGGDLTPIQDLTALQIGRDATGNQVAVDKDGVATYIWRRRNAANKIPWQTRRRLANGQLTATRDLSTDGEGVFTPGVAVDRRGDAVFLFENTQLQSRRLTAAGQLGPLEIVAGASSTPALSLNAAGNGAGAWNTVTVARGALYEGPAAPTSPGGKKIAPAEQFSPVSLKGLKLSRKRFKSARRGRAIAPKGRRLRRRVGTRVRYRLSEKATVTFRIQRARKAKGRIVDGKCVRRTRRNARRRKCTRYRTLKGKLTDKGERGVNRFRFTGRLLGKRLRRGRHRLVGRATDELGNKSNRVRVRFRIVRR